MDTHSIKIIKFPLSNNRAFTQDGQIITNIETIDVVAVADEKTGRAFSPVNEDGTAYRVDVAGRRKKQLVSKQRGWELFYELPNSTGAWSLAVYQDKLYVGGTYLTEGRLWTYDGTSWAEDYTFADIKYVYALKAFSSKLHAGVSTTGKIYEYNGSIWSEKLSLPSGGVYAFEIYNNELYAGTSYSGIIYKYNGSSWSINYNSPEVAVYSLRTYNSKLYAGTWSLGRIYEYNGSSWSLSYDSDERYIRAMSVYNGDLYAGAEDGKVFKYNGSTWSLDEDFGENKHIYSSELYSNSLYMGGNYGRIYKYNGSAWKINFESGGTMYDFAEYQGRFYAANSGGDIYRY